MKAGYKVIQIKGKNGAVYTCMMYEDRSYRDKKKGYSTHDRKCIGKLGPDGKPVYNEYYRSREKMEALEKNVKEMDTASTT